ncbi:hypothetical protein [Mesoterricola sediminis]|uniref:Uncharacterized protein n=1 Tax=Mesoterricola sediminis TaxID=2927980 RepID=A0AA48KDF4_9BACT|nr:hypothetical protein [Mesoterricola sediminis]BDU76267.1 hypothetical protein METESE_12250 [Mesoterricola sediminis]
MRHDAKACRGRATSEQIRVSLGLLTPQERKAMEEAERKRQMAQAKEAAKGAPLLLEGLE